MTAYGVARGYPGFSVAPDGRIRPRGRWICDILGADREPNPYAEAHPLGRPARCFVVSLPDDAAAQANRLAVMEDRVAAWLAEQSPEAVRSPRRNARREPDADFDAALESIRARARDVDPTWIAAEVAEALAEARALPPEAAAELDAELEAILREGLTAAD